jgi:hypothetical protein
MDASHDVKSNDSGPGNNWPRRFSWPMRLFVICFVGDMVVRSLLALTNCDSTWTAEYGIAGYPKPLPAPAELRQIASGEHPQGVTSKTERLWQSVASIGPFFSPMPSAETQAKLNSAEDYGKYAITWVVTRLSFVGKLVGVDQDWPMFSPNVGNEDTLARLRLVYADGTSEICRHTADPADLTRYGHWFEEKAIQICLKLHRDYETRMGYCGYLTTIHKTNAAGSPLARIEVFKVWYVYPSPSDDAFAFLSAQTGPPVMQQDPVFWIYDVATRTGKFVP